MFSRTTVLLGAFFLGGGVAFSPEALAADLPDVTSIGTFSATDSSCPTEDSFRAQARLRVSRSPDRSRMFAVSLRPARRGFEGTVEAIEETGSGSRVVASRTVRGETCSDVASATLLLVALGSLDDVPRDEGSAALGARTARPRDEPPAPPPRDAARRGEFQVVVVGAVAGGLGAPAAGGGLRVGVGLGGPGWFRPHARLGIDLFADAQLENRAGTATRSLVAGRADVCPLGVSIERVVLSLCGAGAVGQVRVKGDAVANPRDEARLYGALGGLARVRVRAISQLGVELAVGVLAPLVHHRFFFEPNVDLFALDAPIPFAEAGLSWSIP